MAVSVEGLTASSADTFPLNGVDHVHFYAGNAKQAAYYYRAAFGMRLAAYRGPETGSRDLVTYLLEQGRIRFLVSTPLSPDHPMQEHIRRHGDGIRDIAMEVDDAETSWRIAVGRGAESAYEPIMLEDAGGRVRMSGIKAYGDTIHSFVERRNYGGAFLPGFDVSLGPDPVSRPAGLKHIDHMVGNVGWGEMNRWVAFYRTVMGFSVFQSFDDKDISTEYSALMSKVMSNGNGRIKFPINEPAEGRRKSQVEEYLEFNGGPGVQHVAMSTMNIVDTVTRLQAQGVEFLNVPTTYYRDLTSRVGAIDEPLELLERLGILVDRDDEGYLLQIFTKPVEDRPTLFFEIIERKGSRGFGKGNFKALFEAIEREQAIRGNL
jgi:4-hydroxyphenylpyruvate dioxygenase